MKAKEIKFQTRLHMDLQDGGYLYLYESTNFPHQLTITTLRKTRKSKKEEISYKIVGEETSYPSNDEFKAELLKRGWIEPDEVEASDGQ